MHSLLGGGWLLQRFLTVYRADKSSLLLFHGLKSVAPDAFGNALTVEDVHQLG